MRAIPSYRRWQHHFLATACRPRASDGALVQRMRDAAARLRKISSTALAVRVQAHRKQVQLGGKPLACDVLVPMFALTIEAVRRVTGYEYYDVQLLAGLALATGAAAEMKAGEGKTIVAILPAALYALTGKGVHVATVNHYLAARDHALVSPVLAQLGVTVGLIAEGDPPDVKRRAYAQDITYGTGYEFGFDYLRDQALLRNQGKPRLGESLRQRLRGKVARAALTMQRGHALAIIDEIDSVLIDEASSPLILSGTVGNESDIQHVYEQAAAAANQLLSDRDYHVNRRLRAVHLTEVGQATIYQRMEDLPQRGLLRPWASYVEQALRARLLLKRDVDYVVRDGTVMLVDQYTGRIFANRSWRDGLHQAVEFKEGITITPEKQSLARISRQRYFGLYRGLCGMSGTVSGHEAEFQSYYGMPVVVIPERLPSRRTELPTRYFGDRPAKWNCVVADVRLRHERRQPVLVGTRTIEESLSLSARLAEQHVPHTVLNGTQDEEEAALVAQAGCGGAVMIATNMAGRGTDIKIDAVALSAGGLHVLATQRQESLRVDRQLVGRSARQGQPGSCQFFVAADDQLLLESGPELSKKIQAAAARDENGEACGAFDVEIRRVQQRAERRAFAQRCELYRHDQWLNDVLLTLAETSPAVAAAG